MFVIFYVILIYINESLSDCIIDNRSPENTWEQKLIEDIKCNYRITDSPKPNSTVYVDLKFSIKALNFENDEEVLIMNSWVSMSWNDDRLTWNASDYDGIQQTIVMSLGLWLPGLRLINLANGDDYDSLFYDPCQLSSNGNILCILRARFEARCSTKLTHWPYDIQTCPVEFGSWSREGTKVIFKFGESAYSIRGSAFGGQWNLIDLYNRSDPNSEIQLKFLITLERQAISLATIIVYPSLILSVLNIASMALDVRSNVRLGMICFSLACHFLFLSELNLDIPKRSIDSPIIIFYYRGSLLITLTLIFLNFVLGVMCKKKSTPLLVSNVNDTVLKGRLKYFVWSYWDWTVDKDSEEWTKFANIVNSFCFIVITTVYICLYIAFMPRHTNV